ncbi:MAG: hypothetical protein C0601_10260 [Candidatus Muiribacterium halophilum]|uniref:Acyl-CoA thioesterase n=1 Tax=Muiribacterium halophilum TaxID=2053465 RepID=A0A2N5ZCP4_MUIH1|nr:MAG: hypothetical protein C0601_10260 [Candidatus Muirbacterium halophilum]
MASRIRVRYSETDKMGRVYHSHYLVWFEIARVDLMRDKGLVYSQFEKEKSLYLPVRDVQCKYKFPLFYDDEIDVETSLDILDKKRIRFNYKIIRITDRKICAIGNTIHVFIDKEGVLQQIPEEFTDLF